MLGIWLYVLFHFPSALRFNAKAYLAMHCNLLGAPPCCSGTKCNKVGRSDNNTFMCEKESGDDDKKQCLVLGGKFYSLYITSILEY